MDTQLKLQIATEADIDAIMQLIQAAILKRKQEGSEQWQDGYPNINVIQDDIKKEFGYIALNNDLNVVAYYALIFEPEPAYDSIEGNWITNYLVIHRLAVNQSNPIKGLGTWMLQQAEAISLKNQIFSIKVDTNFDNIPMLKVFNNLGYQYCGEVYFRGKSRMAFEKVLQ